MSHKAHWICKNDTEDVEIKRSEESKVDLLTTTNKENTNATNESNNPTVNRRCWRAWTLLHFDHLPDWLQDNEYLRSRHRPPMKSVWKCLKSIFSLHSETGNIWTHLLGCIAFIALAIWFLCRSGSSMITEEKAVFSFYFLGAILCLGLSFSFHTMNCYSRPVAKVFQKLDYVGIALLIIGSFIPWIYYVFYCQIVLKVSYISMIVALGILAIIVSLCNKFAEKNYRPIRAAVFVAMGLSAMVPVLHFLIIEGFSKLVDEGGFYWLIGMACSYLIGALIYALRMPERFCPGRFDLCFQSHQIFHMFVVAAAFIHYVGVTKMVQHRLKFPCSNSSILTTIYPILNTTAV